MNKSVKKVIQYAITFVKVPKHWKIYNDIPTNGRWNIIYDKDIVNRKIDLANYDNCFVKIK